MLEYTSLPQLPHIPVKNLACIIALHAISILQKVSAWYSFCVAKKGKERPLHPSLDVVALPPKLSIHKLVLLFSIPAMLIVAARGACHNDTEQQANDVCDQ